MMARKPARVPIHPGEILREEFMQPLSLSINALARALHVQPMRISEIVNERRGISADSALRLARYFGNSAEFWLNMQAAYELDLASQNADKIAREVQPRVA
jgi:addiction module HigA family antidote